MIRLDAIPLADLSQVHKTALSEASAARINCVLQSGHLSDHQELEVQVNGVPQMEMREEDQSVFTWQVFRASDEIHIALLSRGRRMKYWQGCWNERDAILYAGTLPVHVFFNGKLQPLMETTSDVPASLAEAVNGRKPLKVEDLEGMDGETGHEVIQRVFLQNLLVSAESRSAPEASLEKEGVLNEEQQEESAVDQEGMEEPQEREAGGAFYMEEKESDEETQWRGGERGADEGEDQWEESDLDVDERQREDIPDVDTAEKRDVELVREEEQRSFPLMGRRIAAFHAAPLAREETLQALKKLVATMSPKTLIVDIRPKSPSKKRTQQSDALSKHHLRSVFGAMYWDRCWAIHVISQTIPQTNRDGSATWRYVVSTPESHPDGIPSLAKKLEEGYSIVVIDSSATYGMSRRRAVIEELRQRVSGLEVGPLG